MTGWKTRALAIEILNSFEKNGKLREHFEGKLSEIDRQDKAFVRELVSGSVRFLRLLDFCVEEVSQKKQNKQSKY